jgi:sugar-specific transcriptional regulator TrmB
MPRDNSERLEAECAELLQEFGFTEYEAFTFVSLLRLGTGTARQIADVGHVPRTRVYDAVETLHEAGFVDVKHASPKQYTAISRETAVRTFDMQRQNTIEELGELFAELEPVDGQSEEFGVWTVTGRRAVASRALEFIDEAEEQIAYMTVDELLGDDHLDRLAAATERGVDVNVAGVSPTVEERIEERVPSTSVFESLWDWSKAGAGSLLVTDERTALVSVLRDDAEAGTPDETAIWGSGEQNNLVVVLRTLFTQQLGAGGTSTGGADPGSE